MPKLRTRLALGLISLAVIALELDLMRALSLRLWHHFATMVISVALLGFGASGTALTLLRRAVLRRPQAWFCSLTLGFALSVPLSHLLSQRVGLSVEFLAWNVRDNVLPVALLGLLMFVPFLLAGAAVGVALMDRPDRIGGHYGANLIGSGVGAVAAVAAMYVLDSRALFVAIALLGWVAGLIVLPWRMRPRRAILLAAATAVGLVFLETAMPYEADVSPFKMLSQVRLMPGTRVLHRAEGPLGRIDVVQGPAIHYAPGLSLQNPQEIPPHALLIVDGHGTSAVYRCPEREQWAFLDQTSAAAPYHLISRPRVLLIGAGGGADIGLGRYHRSAEIVALEMNRQVIATMTGPLAQRGGDIYGAFGVEVLNREARGYLATANGNTISSSSPAVDAFGASGAGLYAAQESYLYTVESFMAMLGRLSAAGVLCVTRWARTPPRDGLRVLDIAAEALRRRGRGPATHLAMIRSRATVTVLAFAQPVDAPVADRLRRFCRERGFDLCYLPDMAASEANRYHVLERPDYYEGARALLGPGREAFLANYVFDLRAPTDDRPYFFQFFRWRALGALKRQLGGRSPAFLELGYLMLVVALCQTVVMAAILILLPLLPGLRVLWTETRSRQRAVTLGYFLLLGVGFMLLEVGCLQRFILYLAHPIFAAAAVICGFLVFAGLGSLLTARWRGRRQARRVATAAAVAVVGIALLYLFGLSPWLRLTQTWAMPLRFGIAVLTLAPLAFAMGHLFPLGLRRVALVTPSLVPWSWGVNGFASVAAGIATPLLSMEIGFSRVMLLAIVLYAAAGVLFHALPGATSGRMPEAAGGQDGPDVGGSR